MHRASGQEFEPPCCEVGEVSGRAHRLRDDVVPSRMPLPFLVRACREVSCYRYPMSHGRDPRRIASDIRGNADNVLRACLRVRQVLPMSAALEGVGLFQGNRTWRRGNPNAWLE